MVKHATSVQDEQEHFSKKPVSNQISCCYFSLTKKINKISLLLSGAEEFSIF
jgi:hypothetical protein